MNIVLVPVKLNTMKVVKSYSPLASALFVKKLRDRVEKGHVFCWVANGYKDH